MTTGGGAVESAAERAARARQSRRRWKVFGTLALTVTLVVGAVQTWAMAVQQRTDSERTYPVAVTRVRLDTGSAVVTIRPGSEGRVVVRQHLDWMIRKPVVSALFDQDGLEVRMRCNQVLPVTDLGCGALIELEVPAGVAVEGKQSSGVIDLAGLTGAVDLASTSGEVRLAGLSGPVTVRSTSGSVRGSELSSAKLDVAATSGSVELGFLVPPHNVDIGVTSGSVTMALPTGSRYDFDGGSAPRGRIDPTLADHSSPYKVRISVSSGTVSVFSKGGDLNVTG
ncbi:DUF4097 family beta strand repeat-containing protein [Kitasatospora sp. NPDC093806]|uniref:DUF4097 family beta strand repeat-containing protein n=1 Tax=Kitasatospora sp. NPDC093806 TaxID=3155075 RepID=UPI0034425781